MDSQNSQLDSLNINFVVFSKYENEQSCSEDMWDAFNKCEDNNLQPRWVTEEQCKKMDPSKTDIFVFEEFSGEIFEHLRRFRCLYVFYDPWEVHGFPALDCRIVGPPCLLRCFLTCESVPEGTSPVYTTAMQGLVITTSGFTSEVRADIQKHVEYMGGIYCKDLRGCVTHLVANSATSTKFEAACTTNIPVYTYDWIKRVWQENLKTFVKATEPRFDRYKCPVFLNIVVTASNMGKKDKEKVKQLITSHGGEFMGPLDGTKVTAVITNEFSTNSDKIKYAMNHNLPCIKQDWVVNSVKAGYALPFHEYLITPKEKRMKCSTPEPGNTPQLLESFNCSGMSIIPHSTRNFIDDTLQSTASSISESILATPSYVRILETLDVKEAKKAGPFLDGCNIYLAGFVTQHRDKVNKILNAGSATRFDDLSDALSHVIVGDKSKAASELKQIKSKSLNPHIVAVSWLQESIKLKKPAPEDAHSFDKPVADRRTAEPASPLSKKSIQMLQKPRRPPVPQFDFNKLQDDEPDIVQQYLNKSSDKPPDPVFNSRPSQVNFHSSPTEASKTASGSDPVIRNSHSVSLGAESSVTQSTVPEQIFNGLVFLMVGFDDEDYLPMNATIESVGGKLFPPSYKGIPDYAIVPLTGATVKHTVDEIVTPLFIEECVESDKIVEIMYYHRPFSIPADAKPLEDCVVAISGYSNSERYYLQQLALALGANCQDNLSRRTNIEKNQYAATHLICLEPVGNKYNAAVKWKLPAVTAEWLRACSERLTLVDETPFLVGETVAPARKPEDQPMGPPLTPAARQILTPKRRLSQTSGLDTPLINKRLNLSGQQNSQSPFHVNTPRTPYGLTLNANPSASLKKSIAKWISDCPKNKPDPPRQRPVGTPLSELKRRIWAAALKPPEQSDNQSMELCQDPEEQQSIHSPRNENSLSRTETPQRESLRVNSTRCSANDNSVEVSCEEEIGAPVPKQLFADEVETENNPINEQLEHMNKLLNSARGSSTESRYSLNENRVYEELKEHTNYLVPDTQPESVGWEDPNPPKITSTRLLSNSLRTPESSLEPSRLEISIRDTPRRKFMLSGVKDKTSYEEAIRQLGGEVSSDTNFDPTATHLLCMRPSRNEKMLGSIASGKWILHCTYIRACENAGEFVDEEEFEWGNPKCDKTKELTAQQEIDLAKATYRWRIKLSNKNSGAYENMVAILMVPKEKHQQFERLINAGGGIVVPAKHPYDSPKGKKITHCFIQVSKVEQPIDWAMLASKGILCFLPTYLNFFLTEENRVNPRDHVIQDFKKYLSLFPK